MPRAETSAVRVGTGGRVSAVLLLALGAGALLLACTQAGKGGTGAEARRPVRVRVLYTNDEHGWIEGMREGRGAAEMAGLWRAERAGHDDLLVLSGGDNWTGPAISTWFEGRSAVEVLNEMGYAASAVGNHEFDFGLETLARRAGEADFAYLAANLTRRSTGELPAELGIRSQVVVERAGLRIGIIGLTTIDTPSTTNPQNVAALEFGPYEPALRRAAAAARAEGAQALVVVAHVCVGAVRELAARVEDLDVAFFGAGHCNERHAGLVGGRPLISAGAHFRSYGAVTLSFDRRTGRLLDGGEPAVVSNGGGAPVPAVAAVVERWREQTRAQVGSVVAHLAEALPRRSVRLEHLLTSAWLEAVPGADIALMNRGGVRGGLPAGPVTIADLIAVLPFQNTLVEARLPGAVVAEALGAHRPIVGGLVSSPEGWRLVSTGELLSPTKRYRVLANSFCLAGGDGWTFLAEHDPQARDTGLHFRQPLLDWLEARPSSPDAPLSLPER